MYPDFKEFESPLTNTNLRPRLREVLNWCWIVDSFQSSVIEQYHNQKLNNLVNLFNLSGELLSKRVSYKLYTFINNLFRLGIAPAAVAITFKILYFMMNLGIF
jgi:hypothetical protein